MDVKIKEGKCKGMVGEIVDINSNEVHVEIDFYTIIKTPADNVEEI
jgi:ribosomal protein L24